MWYNISMIIYWCNDCSSISTMDTCNHCNGLVDIIGEVHTTRGEENEWKSN